jgi:hypothetical protein
MRARLKPPSNSSRKKKRLHLNIGSVNKILRPMLNHKNGNGGSPACVKRAIDACQPKQERINTDISDQVLKK